MCGRFALIASFEKIKLQFSINNHIELAPRFNIAPGSSVACVVAPEPGYNECVLFHWGLIPSWTTDRKKYRESINARSETIFEKATFRTCIKSKRCLLLMSGFFEWHPEQDIKQPYYFKSNANEILAVAAIWDTWQGVGEVIHSCCLITTAANELMMPIHHRMPVVLDKFGQNTWLDNVHYDKQRLSELLKPSADNSLVSYPVTPLMNRTQFDNSLAIEPFF